MRLPSRLRALALLLPLAVTALAHPALAAGTDVEKVSLHDSMERIDVAYKALRKILRNPESAQPSEALPLVATLKAEAARCRELEPKTVSALPEAERAASLKAYHEQMDAFVKSIGELEQAVQAGDWTRAGEIARALQKQKSDGHDRFKGE
jgi:soluble cytochrome b562